MGRIQPVAVMLTTIEIEAVANDWLDEHLSDRFVASRPILDGAHWRVPVLLAYPGIVVGQVGELWMSVEGEVMNATDAETMKDHAQILARTNHAEIEAAFLLARNP